MNLYEKLLYLHGSPAAIAKGFAEYLDFGDYVCPEKAIPKELNAIIRARNEIVAEWEIDLELSESRISAQEEFASIVFPGCSPAEPPTEAQRAAWEAQHKTECEEFQREHEAKIKAIDTLFLTVCRALRAWGYRITPGQLSALKREKIPGRLCEELDRLKRPKPALLPPGERLDNASAGALYAALARMGLLSGSYEAFAFYLGGCTTQEKKAPEIGLKWNGTLSGFAYFARCFSKYTQSRAGYGHIVREKALCRAFGIDDRKRKNTIHPYLVDRKCPRAGLLIESAFDEAKEAREKALARREQNAFASPKILY